LSKPVTLVMVGIGGYGEEYLSALLEEPEGEGGSFSITGAVDPESLRSKFLAKLNALKIPMYASLDEFYEKDRADLAVISSPIHFHAPQTCLALSRGSHVLCEKPAAATVQEVDRMIQYRDRFQKKAAIGYQWSFSPSIQALKKDIRAGHFGAPKGMKSLCLWPRNRAYYGRNQWAGKIRDDRGNWILDSPANNAMAHDLHNMLYLLGESGDRSARPVEVTAELYRANAIPNYDTAALRVRTEEGVEILFYGSHAILENRGPVFSFDFEKGSVSYGGGESPIRARFRDGRSKEYPAPDSERQTKKLWTCLRTVREGGPIPCGLEAARAQTLCVNGAQDSMEEIATFPKDLVHVSKSGGSDLCHVYELAEALTHCFQEGLLPSEAGFPWARVGRLVDLTHYRKFPGG
jgi:predicted dehydrogenase